MFPSNLYRDLIFCCADTPPLPPLPPPPPGAPPKPSGRGVAQFLLEVECAARLRAQGTRPNRHPSYEAAKGSALDLHGGLSVVGRFSFHPNGLIDHAIEYGAPVPGADAEYGRILPGLIAEAEALVAKVRATHPMFGCRLREIWNGASPGQSFALYQKLVEPHPLPPIVGLVEVEGRVLSTDDTVAPTLTLELVSGGTVLATFSAPRPIAYVTTIVDNVEVKEIAPPRLQRTMALDFKFSVTSATPVELRAGGPGEMTAYGVARVMEV